MIGDTKQIVCDSEPELIGEYKHQNSELYVTVVPGIRICTLLYKM